MSEPKNRSEDATSHTEQLLAVIIEGLIPRRVDQVEITATLRRSIEKDIWYGRFVGRLQGLALTAGHKP